MRAPRPIVIWRAVDTSLRPQRRPERRLGLVEAKDAADGPAVVADLVVVRALLVVKEGGAA